MKEQSKKVPRKEIDQEKAQAVVSQFAEIPQVLSPRKFLEANFHTLNNGTKVADIHQFLVNNGIDVGSLAYFRKLWGQVKKQQKASQPKKPSRSEKTMPPAEVAKTPSPVYPKSTKETVPVTAKEANSQPSAPMPKPDSAELNDKPKKRTPRHWKHWSDCTLEELGWVDILDNNKYEYRLRDESGEMDLSIRFSFFRKDPITGTTDEDREALEECLKLRKQRYTNPETEEQLLCKMQEIREKSNLR